MYDGRGHQSSFPRTPTSGCRLGLGYRGGAPSCSDAHWQRVLGIGVHTAVGLLAAIGTMGRVRCAICPELLFVPFMLFLLCFLSRVGAYDEIETQLQKLWRHTSTPLEPPANHCLKVSMSFPDERSEDAWLAKFVSPPFIPGGYSSGVSDPRRKATAILAKAALVLPTMGDFAETGLNAGSTAAILMRTLMHFDNCGRKFWGFDSFTGLPPNITAEDGVWGISGKKGDMAVDRPTFEGNMKRWDAWNESIVVITPGYFADTLPASPIQKISFLRLDGDIFASTWEALEFLYHKVVPGGYIYIDDYGSFEGCREAVDKFRIKHHIYEPLHFIREENQIRYIHFEAVWWKKRGHSDF